MGNTRIQDANTGHIMGLREGFIPIGMKEHGGVLYITSVNKEGEGEIGTIPSPIIRDFLKEKVEMDIPETAITSSDKGTGSEYVRISNKLYPGEKFLMRLNLQDINKGNACKTLEKPNFCYKHANGSFEFVTVKYPLIGGYKFTDDDIKAPKTEDEPYKNSVKYTICSDLGVYKIVLFSQSSNGVFRAGERLMEPQVYTSKTGINKDYPQWFINDSETLNPDLRLMNRSGHLKSYPSTSLPGYLCVKAELNSKEITRFEILKRKSEGLKVPFTVKVYSSNSDYNYYTYFPGFWYETNSFSYIKTMKVTCFNESTGEYLGLELVRRTKDKDVTKDSAATEIEINAVPDADASLDASSLVEENDYLFNVTYTQNYILSTEDRSRYCITNRGDFVNSWVDDGVTDGVGTSVKKYTNTTNEADWDKNAVYGGLFHINFGQDFNLWCKLEITFYNLYDDLIGTCTCKFNPYLNDTFGTNDVPTSKYAEWVNMTKLFYTPSKSVNTNEKSYTIDNKDKSVLGTTGSKWWLDNTSAKSGEPFNIAGNTCNFEKTLTLTETLHDCLYTNSTVDDNLKCTYTFKYQLYPLGVSVYNHAINTDGSDISSDTNVGECNAKYGFSKDSGGDPSGNHTRVAYYLINTINVNINNTQYSKGFTKDNNVSIFGYKYDNKKFYICAKTSVTADMSSQSPITVTKTGELTKTNSTVTSNSTVASVFGKTISCSYCGKNQLDWLENNKINTKSPESISIESVTYLPKCLPFYLSFTFKTKVTATKTAALYNSCASFIPYVIHQQLPEGKTEKVSVGKLYTKGDWKQATTISWNDFIVGKNGSKTDVQNINNNNSSRIVSWTETRYTNLNTATLGANSVYIINFSGKYGDGKLKIDWGDSEIDSVEIYESDLYGGNRKKYYMPIVIRTGNSNATVTVNLGSASYVTSAKYGKVDSKYEPSIGQCMWSRLDKYNKQCDDNKKEPIILPLVSCYREAYWDNNKEKSFVLYSKVLKDSSTNFAIYFPPANYMCYTIDESEKDADLSSYTDWYYQVSCSYSLLTSSKTTTENLSQLFLHIVPGADAGAATNTSMFGTKPTFATIWKPN